jgi:hypothetical protein
MVSACGGSTGGAGSDFEGAAVDGKADGVSRTKKTSVDVGASLAFGGSGSIEYTGHPRFSALKISANAGDHLVATITSSDGVPVSYLLGDGTADYYKLVGTGKDKASQDVATQTLDVTIPANGSYYLAVRDQDLYTATFQVSVAAKSAVLPAAITACASDSDCVAVYQGGCCPHGVRFAVNANQVQAYMAATTCSDHVFCPYYLVNDTHVPSCDTSSGQCVMVEPKACGGIAGLSCPANQTCTDNPNDGCDPANGGADCGGTCTVQVVTN